MHIFVVKKRNLYIVLALIVILIVGLLFWIFTRDKAVSNYSTIKYTYNNLLPKEAKDLMDDNPHVVILDVRNEKEYNKGHLENAFLLPLKELKARRTELDEGNIYLVYCDNGKNSKKASRFLAESGYPRVYTLVGGYKKWPYEITKSVIDYD
ncbi:rhodanese-like domain-containing protein [Natronincola ferrireducens]|uniref:Rhodanese-related sulfurtransferase n=1 Tax=Natronincola ferrireducens TaxID=393762 RepID=A0A1G8WVN7_9FIRM|nr:rhodanese-like domain-containing protein [Natronincola ferrireducens]SDJ82428.1 Rhodanese-related sulfurtransferase [Natronincola ferrireducens]